MVNNENVEIGHSYTICVEELQVAAGVKSKEVGIEICCVYWLQSFGIKIDVTWEASRGENKTPLQQLGSKNKCRFIRHLKYLEQY